MRAAQVTLGVCPRSKNRVRSTISTTFENKWRVSHVVSVDLWNHSSGAVRPPFDEGGKVDLPAPHL